MSTLPSNDKDSFNSDKYYYPVFGSKPRIHTYEGGTYILPNVRKYTNIALTAKAIVVEPNGINMHMNSPSISVYDEKLMRVFGSSDAKMARIQQAGDGSAYQHAIGRLPAGKYTYEINARNEYGLEADTVRGDFEVYDTVKAGITKDTKVFNAPNPFNPVRRTTKIVFNAKAGERVTIKIYSPYGDKVFEDTYTAHEGTNEYEYRGKDNYGKVLFNGFYICYVEKSSGNGKCKIVVSK